VRVTARTAFDGPVGYVKKMFPAGGTGTKITKDCPARTAIRDEPCDEPNWCNFGERRECGDGRRDEWSARAMWSTGGV
jgi:hypothetical protein